MDGKSETNTVSPLEHAEIKSPAAQLATQADEPVSKEQSPSSAAAAKSEELPCGAEALAVLNCVADSRNDFSRCTQLMGELRKCTQAKVSSIHGVTRHRRRDSDSPWTTLSCQQAAMQNARMAERFEAHKSILRSFMPLVPRRLNLP